MSNTSVRMLPDAYAKGVESNNYKLLRLLNLLYDDLKADLKSINRARDINFAAGDTLDNIGAMAGVQRGGDTDEQYRLSILSRVAALSTTGDYQSTVDRIELMFGLESGTISLVEMYQYSTSWFDTMTSVAVRGLPLDILQDSNFTAEQVYDLISSVIPAGVGLVPLKFAGTLLLYFGSTTQLPEYPTLFGCWLAAQRNYARSGVDVGLAGEMNVPEEFAETAQSMDGVEYPTTGTMTGGTLGARSDYIMEVV